tara:strand:+ start:925 stop:1218 length:294 start_codon:yes stop_codon:yes gene_type:complete
VSSQDPKPLKAAIEQFIRVNRMQSKMDEVDIVLAWKSCFGKMVDRQTRSIRLKAGGQLWVSLESGPLKEELLMNKTKVVERINEQIGRKIIKELVIQ